MSEPPLTCEQIDERLAKAEASLKMLNKQALDMATRIAWLRELRANTEEK